MTTNWDKTKPAGSDKIRLSDDMLRDNFAALEDAIGRDHEFPGNEGSDAGQHNVITLIDQGADEAAPDAGLIKIWNNGDALKFRVPSGAVRMFDAIPSGEIILFEKDTTVAGYTLQTDVDDRLCFISKGSAAGGQTGGGNHSSGTWTQPDHTHTGPNHRHVGRSHTHSMQSHTHAGPSHTHTTGSLALTSSHLPALNATLPMYSLANASGAGDPAKIGRGNDAGGSAYNLNVPVKAGSASAHNHGSTGSSGTGATGAPSTANTGTGGAVWTDYGGTGSTGSSATANTWRPAARVFTRQQRI